MKTTFNGREIAHIWARQSQPSGKSPNQFFEGSEIYSYGHHFCMAKIIAPNVVFVTPRRYSNTTAKHLCWLRYAVNHFEQISVPYPEESLYSGGSFYQNKSTNAQYWINEIQDQLNIIGNTRTRPETKERAQNTLRSIVASIDRYCELTKQSINQRHRDKDLARKFRAYYKAAKSEQASEALGAKLQAIERTKRKEETAKQKERLNKWLRGELVDGWFNSDKVYLRVSPVSDEVETSKGARVSLKAAKVLYGMIQKGQDVKGHQISGYTVIGINGVLTIGCHKIERSEIERFAQTQNW